MNPLVKAAEEILHLHICEQEGLQSGQPTPKMWFDAVNNLSKALNQSKEIEEQTQEQYWNKIVAEIATADICKNTVPGDLDGLNNWKIEVIRKLSAKFIINESKENEGKQAGVWVKASETENLPAFGKQVICVYSPRGLNLCAELKFADRNHISFLAKESNVFDVYWLDESIQSGERGEVERLKGLIENIFKANEETMLDITEPRDNIEINWKKFKSTHNL